MANRPTPTQSLTEPRSTVLEHLLAANGDRLLSHARRHAQRAADAEEALQTACALFLERYEGGCDPLAWLYTTVKREAWAIRRRGSRRRECGFTGPKDSGGSYDLTETLSADTSDPEQRALRRELHREHRGALAALKPAERTALLLRALGYTYHEIMALQDWSYTKVNRSLAEGRAALRALEREQR